MRLSNSILIARVSGLGVAVALFCGFVAADTARAEGGFDNSPLRFQNLEKKAETKYSKNHPADASAEVSVGVAASGADVSATTGAEGYADGTLARAGAWDDSAAAITEDGKNGKVTVNSLSRSIGFNKGTNALTKARSDTKITVEAGGNTVVVEELAIAIARSSQFGSSAAAAADHVISGNGYSGTTVATTKGSSR